MVLGRELTVAILPHFSVLCSIDDERLVASSSELLCVGVVNLEGDGFTTEPVACKLVSKEHRTCGEERRTDVIGISVEQVDAQPLVKEILEILTEVREDEVASVLELPRHR